MSHRALASVFALALATTLGPASDSAAQARLSPAAEVANEVGISGASLEGSQASFSLHNRTGGRLQDVQVMVQAVFHWNDDMNPGPTSPGRASVHLVPGPIDAGASEAVSVRFSPPLESRSDGWYELRTWVQGYRSVGP